MDALGAVHLALIVLEAGGDRHRGLDGVHPRLHVADMRRTAGHRDPGPDHPDFGGIDGGQSRPGFRDDHRVGRWQRQHGRQRPVAGAFLLDHRLHLHHAGGLQPGEAEGLERHAVGDDPRLHVPRAAPIHASATDIGDERRRRPHVRRAFRHHVDMALQRQAAAATTAGLVHRHDVVATLVADQRRGEPGVRCQPRRVRWHPPWGQSQSLIDLGHGIERRAFIAQCRLAGDQTGQGPHRFLPLRIDRVEDRLPGAGVDRKTMCHGHLMPAGADCADAAPISHAPPRRCKLSI